MAVVFCEVRNINEPQFAAKETTVLTRRTLAFELFWMWKNKRGKLRAGKARPIRVDEEGDVFSGFLPRTQTLD